MKVYVVTRWDYESRDIITVYEEDRKEDAEALADMMDGGDVETVDLNPEVPYKVQGYKKFHLRMNAELQCATVSDGEKFQRFPGQHLIKTTLLDQRGSLGIYPWSGWAWGRDEEEAIANMRTAIQEHIAQEQQAQHEKL